MSENYNFINIGKDRAPLIERDIVPLRYDNSFVPENTDFEGDIANVNQIPAENGVTIHDGLQTNLLTFDDIPRMSFFVKVDPENQMKKNLCFKYDCNQCFNLELIQIEQPSDRAKHEAHMCVPLNIVRITVDDAINKDKDNSFARYNYQIRHLHDNTGDYTCFRDVPIGGWFRTPPRPENLFGDICMKIRDYAFIDLTNAYTKVISELCIEMNNIKVSDNLLFPVIRLKCGIVYDYASCLDSANKDGDSKK